MSVSCDLHVHIFQAVPAQSYNVLFSSPGLTVIPGREPAFPLLKGLPCSKRRPAPVMVRLREYPEGDIPFSCIPATPGRFCPEGIFVPVWLPVEPSQADAGTAVQ